MVPQFSIPPTTKDSISKNHVVTYAWQKSHLHRWLFFILVHHTYISNKRNLDTLHFVAPLAYAIYCADYETLYEQLVYIRLKTTLLVANSDSIRHNYAS